MTIKTFRGRTIADALDALKRDMGPDAVILNTRTFKAGGVFGLGARSVTEIIATTHAGAGRARKAPASKPQAPREAVSPASDLAATYTPGPRRPAAVRTPAPVPAAPGATSAPAVAAGGLEGGAPPALRDVARLIMAASTKTPIEQEIASIKKMVGQVLRTSSGSRQGAMPDALFDCYRRLLEAEVAAEIADEVTDAVRGDLSPDQMLDPGSVHAAMVRRLAGFIPVSGDAGKLGPAPDGRPVTIALLGPTGVGKTTTVAKLAATYKLRHGRRVGLITCDTYRIGAVDQLRTYADIIGLPLRVAMTPAEVRSACAGLADCEAILIDTAGRSPRDGPRLEELSAMLEAARPHQRHLVLSSTASESALAETASAFAPLAYDRVILTKLDEAVNFGVLVNVARRLRTRLSFVTTGQEVPDHIEAGNADRLARCILDPQVAR